MSIFDYEWFASHPQYNNEQEDNIEEPMLTGEIGMIKKAPHLRSELT